MSDTGTIERFLVDRGLSLAGQVVASFDNDVLYFAFVKVIVGNDGRRIPNSFTLKKLSDEAAGIGYKISFVLVDGDRSDLDNSLKNMLFSKFPDKIRNSFAVFLRNRADVWVEPKRLLNENDEQSIHLAISQFLKFLEIEVKSIEITRSANVPTPTAILRAIRIIAPCSAHTLSEELVKRLPIRLTQTATISGAAHPLKLYTHLTVCHVPIGPKKVIKYSS